MSKKRGATTPARPATRRAKTTPTTTTSPKARKRVAVASDTGKASQIVVHPQGEPVSISAPTVEGEKMDTAPPAQELAPPDFVQLRVNHVQALLAVAARKETTRPYLNGVYLHRIGNELRAVATDGHRMLVISQVLPDQALAWGEAGVIVPADTLERIGRFVGKDGALQIGYGVGHQHALIEESGGNATFRVRPIDGQFPPYMRILEGAGASLCTERRPAEAAAVKSAYLKAAGAIATQLGSDAVFSFPGAGDSDPTMFTFPGCPEALLVVMPLRADRPAIAAPTVRLLGEGGIRATLAALKAHQTRNTQAAKAAKDEKEAERLRAVAAGFAARIEELQKGLTPALPAPHAAKEGEAAAA